MGAYTERIYVLVHHCHEQLLKLIHASKPDDGSVPLGINLKQGIILKILLDDDGITQKELTQRLQITSSSCGELIVKLEQGGYLNKRASPDDKRTFNVYLTKRGRALGEQYREQSRVMLEDWGASLSLSEKKQLFSLLTKLSDGLQTQIEGKGV
ncbi:MAG: MarR family transcriptional regulator [Coriobacteriales bacterium]|jgi:DNA-binding MarR family transcriptional regulator|nr:MarR family transcriptional regulator [Coriobacteriales bacterium]